MTPTEPAPKADAPAAGKGRRRWVVVPKRVWATFLAVVAAGPASVGLVFTLFPDTKPDPGNLVTAEIRTAQIDPSVSLGDYILDIREGSTSPNLAKRLGTVVYLSISVEGRKHHDLALFQRLYDAKTHVRVPVAGGDARQAVPSSWFHPETPNDHWVTPIWIDPATPPSRRVFVRFELYNGASMLAFADSRPFSFPKQPNRFG
ncbi:MAG: hypothetical protein QOI73_1672 [Solirubrobacteraceae bacterium]|nr:hypothetical protein [Solirubrobacteraceae bacterium]